MKRPAKKRSELGKIARQLNDRLRQFEKFRGTNSTDYEQLVKNIEKIGGSKSKKGLKRFKESGFEKLSEEKLNEVRRILKQSQQYGTADKLREYKKIIKQKISDGTGGILNHLTDKQLSDIIESQKTTGGVNVWRELKQLGFISEEIVEIQTERVAGTPLSKNIEQAKALFSGCVLDSMTPGLVDFLKNNITLKQLAEMNPETKKNL